MDQTPLHKLMPHVEEHIDGAEAAFERGSVESGAVTAHFGDLTGPLVEFIRGSGAIVGCVAWLTSAPILDALADVGDTAIVVQKEDFLRPDLGDTGTWKAGLRARYDRLTCGIDRFSMPLPLSTMSICTDPAVGAIRCAGHHNTTSHQTNPRMHHKFLVRCVFDMGDGHYGPDNFVPEAVWTGSFNFSANAGQSFENAVEIHDPQIAAAYLQEFARVAAISEPLDWESDWAAPAWRIGS
jgi:hypothetical protein